MILKLFKNQSRFAFNFLNYHNKTHDLDYSVFVLSSMNISLYANTLLNTLEKRDSYKCV